jgi:hypothetical protein
VSETGPQTPASDGTLPPRLRSGGSRFRPQASVDAHTHTPPDDPFCRPAGRRRASASATTRLGAGPPRRRKQGPGPRDRSRPFAYAEPGRPPSQLPFIDEHAATAKRPAEVRVNDARTFSFILPRRGRCSTPSTRRPGFSSPTRPTIPGLPARHGIPPRQPRPRLTPIRGLGPADRRCGELAALKPQAKASCGLP